VLAGLQILGAESPILGGLPQILGAESYRLALNVPSYFSAVVDGMDTDPVEKTERSVPIRKTFKNYRSEPFKS
jgi:hypothetical protein